MSGFTGAEKDIRLTISRSPRLAIVINCYNYERYVADAIKSVLSQPRELYELVVIDDGSTDRSWEIIQSFGVKSLRKSNGGQVSACLLGIDNTSAPFVLFLDADDVLLPNVIPKILSNLTDETAKLQFPLEIIDEQGRSLHGSFPALDALKDRQSFVQDVIQTGAYVSPPTSGNVFRRDVCDLLRDADYDTAADGITLIAAPFMGDIVTLSEPSGCYRVHGRNKSSAAGPPTAKRLHDQKLRFKRRLDHLQRFLGSQTASQKLVDSKRNYFYARYSIYEKIIGGETVETEDLGIIVRNIPSWYSLNRRVIIAAGALSIFLLPRRLIRLLVLARLSGKAGLAKRIAGMKQRLLAPLTSP
jgi:glycosyltransferase involved in cell wall biosynthesis